MKYRKNVTSTNGLDQATLVAGLAALGEDSSESEFNEITGAAFDSISYFSRDSSTEG
jgi:hypothetical protein